MINEDAASDVLSQIYHALRAHRRRVLIRMIVKSDENSLSVRSCARHIAATEEGIPPEEVTSESYRNAYNALSQTHLSTLSDAGLVEYDPDRKTVSAGPNLQFGMLIITLNRATYRSLQGQYSIDIDSKE